MEWGVVESYLSRTFLDGSGLPSPDVVLGIVFTAMSFAIGWMASLRGSRRRIKARVIDELILSQSELKAWAFPKYWKESDTRETRMLDPFVARLRFLHSSVNETKSLKGKQLTLIDAYIMRVEEFIAIWAETKRRNITYRNAYRVSYELMRTAVTDLGLKEMGRLANLALPKDDILDAPPAVSTPSFEPLFSSPLVPAE